MKEVYTPSKSSSVASISKKSVPLTVFSSIVVTEYVNKYTY